MLSVIIPSLFKIERFYQTLEELSQSPHIGEIIVIDNSGVNKNIQISKVRYIAEPKNTFINPAWNKGVALAKYDKLCILNDDIWFDWNVLEHIIPYIIPENGLIGMSETNYGNVTETFKIEKIQPFSEYPRGERNIAYACCFFTHKSNWVNIPHSIKLWCGDDWLFYYDNGLPNYKIKGLQCNGLVSGTLDHTELIAEFNPIKNNDLIEFKKYVDAGIVIAGKSNKIQKRNLIFYCYFNLNNIPSYIHQHLQLLQNYHYVFTGHQIIYIATDDDFIDETPYKEFFSFFPNAIIKVVKNNPETRESEYFLQQLIQSKEIANPNDITFYAHSKGSTYENNEWIFKWVTALYFFNLEPDNIKHIETQFLLNKVFSGIFRQETSFSPWVYTDWHYSGTFFWINNSELFKRENWNKINPGRFAVEEFPGNMAHMSESTVSEMLFSVRTQLPKYLPTGLDHDLRYYPYWKSFFIEDSPILTPTKLQQFNKLLSQIIKNNENQ